MFSTPHKDYIPGLRMLGTTAYNEDTFKDIIQGHNIPLIFDSSDITVSKPRHNFLTLWKDVKTA